MRTANQIETVWLLILLLSICPKLAASVDRLGRFAENCGTTAVVASARVFSDNDKNEWKEYRTAKQIPENAEWSETAFAWARPDSPVFIDVEGIGEDFGDSTYYCFDASGKLSSLDHEFRTAWGWGFVERRKLDSVGHETTESHFFSMKERAEIPRPKDAEDVREAMTVKVYRRLSDVPFSALLAHVTKAK